MKKLLYILIFIITLCLSVSFASTETKEATLYYRNIKISIDEKLIIPMDANKNLVHPFIIDGTTYLPVRAISEALGKDVSWDGETCSVLINDSSNTNNPEETEITPVDYVSDDVKSLYYKDIKIFINNSQIEPKDINGNVVEPFIIDGTTYLPVRAVCEALGSTVDWNEEKREVQIKTAKNSIQSGDSEKTSLISINDVVVKIENEVITIQVTTDGALLGYTYYTIDNPDRIVLDIENSKFGMDTKTQNINYDVIQQIRFGEQDNNVCRIVVDVTDLSKHTYSIVQNDGKTLTYLAFDEKFTVPEEKTDNTNFVASVDDKIYIVESDLAKVSSVKYSSLTNKIKIKIQGEYDYNAFTLDNPNRVVLDLSNASLETSGPKEILPKEKNITAIRFSQYNDNTVRVVIEVKQIAKYSVDKTSKQITLELDEPKSGTKYETDDNTSNEQNTAKTKSEKIVVLLDAGHGGNDPGAINGKYEEKTYNLKIIMKLYDLLNETDGIEPRLIRDGDVYIHVKDRLVKIIENDDADLFVSVHHNSLENKSYTGTMVLYCNKPGEKDEYGYTSKEAAQIIKDKLVSSLNTIDRGIVDRPDLVVLCQNNDNKYPEMGKANLPSVLCEVGFISNDKELANIITDKFQTKAARAIYDGILDIVKLMK